MRVIKVSFVMLMTLGKQLRMGAGHQVIQLAVRGLELSVPAPDLWGGGCGWRLNQLSVANGLINHDYVRKPP